MQRKSIDFLLRSLDVLRLNFCKKIIDYKIKVWYYNTARGTGTPERNKRVATNAKPKTKERQHHDKQRILQRGSQWRSE